jgi:hypothetical protein
MGCDNCDNAPVDEDDRLKKLGDDIVGCDNCDNAPDVWGWDEASWLQCVPWDGEEKSLPVGEQTRIPNFRAVDLVRRWEVLDVEEDEGYRVVKRSEIQPGDTVIGAQINEKSVAKIAATYGPRFFVAKATGVDKLMDRGEWRAAFGTDVLVLQALKEVRQSVAGGGVTAHPMR